MICYFLDALRCNRGDPPVGRIGEALIEHVLPGREQQLPRNRLGEIAIGLLDQQAILPVEHIAMEGQLVGIAGEAEEMRPLPDEVERDVRQAEVDFQRRGVTAPFAEPLAEDERVIAEAKQVIEARGVRLAHGGRVEGAGAGGVGRCVDGRERSHQILPGTGRGTARRSRVVEGTHG